MIYLDNAATTEPKIRIVDAMLPYLYKDFYNPSSYYSKSRNVKRVISMVKHSTNMFLHGFNEYASRNFEDEIIFTSGASESNCLAIEGFIKQAKIENKKPVIITTMIEHKSIIECVDNESNITIYVPVDKNGIIYSDRLEHYMDFYNSNDYKVLVSIQYANNEIGTIQDIKFISDIVHKNRNAILHTDCTQALGKVNINVNEDNIDMLSASGHKIGCPKGIGILFKRKNVKIKPIIYGTQMNGLRGGTENVASIVGWNEAIKICQEDIENNRYDSLYSIKVYLENQLKQKLYNVQFNGIDGLYNILSVTFGNNCINAERLVYALDMDDIYISTGSACNSHSEKPSHVLKAIGLSDEEASRTIRISLPYNVTQKEIDIFLNILEKEIDLQIKMNGGIEDEKFRSI